MAGITGPQDKIVLGLVVDFDKSSATDSVSGIDNFVDDTTKAINEGVNGNVDFFDQQAYFGKSFGRIRTQLASLKSQVQTMFNGMDFSSLGKDISRPVQLTVRSLQSNLNALAATLNDVREMSTVQLTKLQSSQSARNAIRNSALAYTGFAKADMDDLRAIASFYNKNNASGFASFNDKQKKAITRDMGSIGSQMGRVVKQSNAVTKSSVVSDDYYIGQAMKDQTITKALSKSGFSKEQQRQILQVALRGYVSKSARGVHSRSGMRGYQFAGLEQMTHISQNIPQPYRLAYMNFGGANGQIKNNASRTATVQDRATGGMYQRAMAAVEDILKRSIQREDGLQMNDVALQAGKKSGIIGVHDAKAYAIKGATQAQFNDFMARVLQESIIRSQSTVGYQTDILNGQDQDRMLRRTGNKRYVMAKNILDAVADTGFVSDNIATLNQAQLTQLKKQKRTGFQISPKKISGQYAGSYLTSIGTVNDDGTVSAYTAAQINAQKKTGGRGRVGYQKGDLNKQMNESVLTRAIGFGQGQYGFGRDNHLHSQMPQNADKDGYVVVQMDISDAWERDQQGYLKKGQKTGTGVRSSKYDSIKNILQSGHTTINGRDYTLVSQDKQTVTFIPSRATSKQQQKGIKGYYDIMEQRQALGLSNMFQGFSDNPIYDSRMGGKQIAKSIENARKIMSGTKSIAQYYGMSGSHGGIINGAVDFIEQQNTALVDMAAMAKAFGGQGDANNGTALNGAAFFDKQAAPVSFQGRGANAKFGGVSIKWQQYLQNQMRHYDAAIKKDDFAKFGYFDSQNAGHYYMLGLGSQDRIEDKLTAVGYIGGLAKFLKDINSDEATNTSIMSNDPLKKIVDQQLIDVLQRDDKGGYRYHVLMNEQAYKIKDGRNTLGGLNQIKDPSGKVVANAMDAITRYNALFANFKQRRNLTTQDLNGDGLIQLTAKERSHLMSMQTSAIGGYAQLQQANSFAHNKKWMSQSIARNSGISISQRAQALKRANDYLGELGTIRGQIKALGSPAQLIQNPSLITLPQYQSRIQAQRQSVKENIAKGYGLFEGQTSFALPGVGNAFMTVASNQTSLAGKEANAIQNFILDNQAGIYGKGSDRRRMHLRAPTSADTQRFLKDKNTKSFRDKYEMDSAGTQYSLGTMYDFNTGDFDGDFTFIFKAISQQQIHYIEQRNKALQQQQEKMDKLVTNQQREAQKKAKEAVDKDRDIIGSSAAQARLLTAFRAMQGQQGMGVGSAIQRNAQQYAESQRKRRAQLNGRKIYDYWTTHQKSPSGVQMDADSQFALYGGQVEDRFIKRMVDLSNTQDVQQRQKLIDKQNPFATNLVSKYDSQGVQRLMTSVAAREAGVGMQGMFDSVINSVIDAKYYDDSGKSKAARYWMNLLANQSSGRTPIITRKMLDRGSSLLTDWNLQLRKRQQNGQSKASIQKQMHLLNQFRKRLQFAGQNGFMMDDFQFDETTGHVVGSEAEAIMAKDSNGQIARRKVDANGDIIAKKDVEALKKAKDQIFAQMAISHTPSLVAQYIDAYDALQKAEKYNKDNADAIEYNRKNKTLIQANEANQQFLDLAYQYSNGTIDEKSFSALVQQNRIMKAAQQRRQQSQADQELIALVGHQSTKFKTRRQQRQELARRRQIAKGGRVSFTSSTGWNQHAQTIGQTQLVMPGVDANGNISYADSGVQNRETYSRQEIKPKKGHIDRGVDVRTQWQNGDRFVYVPTADRAKLLEERYQQALDDLNPNRQNSQLGVDAILGSAIHGASQAYSKALIDASNAQATDDDQIKKAKEAYNAYLDNFLKSQQTRDSFAKFGYNVNETTGALQNVDPSKLGDDFVEVDKRMKTKWLRFFGIDSSTGQRSDTWAGESGDHAIGRAKHLAYLASIMKNADSLASAEGVNYQRGGSGIEARFLRDQNGNQVGNQTAFYVNDNGKQFRFAPDIITKRADGHFTIHDYKSSFYSAQKGQTQVSAYAGFIDQLARMGLIGDANQRAKFQDFAKYGQIIDNNGQVVSQQDYLAAVQANKDNASKYSYRSLIDQAQIYDQITGTVLRTHKLQQTTNEQNALASMQAMRLKRLSQEQGHIGIVDLDGQMYFANDAQLNPASQKRKQKADNTQAIVDSFAYQQNMLSQYESSKHTIQNAGSQLRKSRYARGIGASYGRNKYMDIIDELNPALSAEALQAAKKAGKSDDEINKLLQQRQKLLEQAKAQMLNAAGTSMLDSLQNMLNQMKGIDTSSKPQSIKSVASVRQALLDAEKVINDVASNSEWFNSDGSQTELGKKVNAQKKLQAAKKRHNSLARQAKKTIGSSMDQEIDKQKYALAKEGLGSYYKTDDELTAQEIQQRQARVKQLMAKSSQLKKQSERVGEDGVDAYTKEEKRQLIAQSRRYAELARSVQKQPLYGAQEQIRRRKRGSQQFGYQNKSRLAKYSDTQMSDADIIKQTIRRQQDAIDREIYNTRLDTSISDTQRTNRINALQQQKGLVETSYRNKLKRDAIYQDFNRRQQIQRLDEDIQSDIVGTRLTQDQLVRRSQASMANRIKAKWDKAKAQYGVGGKNPNANKLESISKQLFGLDSSDADAALNSFFENNNLTAFGGGSMMNRLGSGAFRNRTVWRNRIANERNDISLLSASQMDKGAYTSKLVDLSVKEYSNKLLDSARAARAKQQKGEDLTDQQKTLASLVTLSTSSYGNADFNERINNFKELKSLDIQKQLKSLDSINNPFEKINQGALQTKQSIQLLVKQYAQLKGITEDEAKSQLNIPAVMQTIDNEASYNRRRSQLSMVGQSLSSVSQINGASFQSLRERRNNLARDSYVNDAIKNLNNIKGRISSGSFEDWQKDFYDKYYSDDRSEMQQKLRKAYSEQQKRQQKITDDYYVNQTKNIEQSSKLRVNDMKARNSLTRFNNSLKRSGLGYTMIGRNISQKAGLMSGYVQSQNYAKMNLDSLGRQRDLLNEKYNNGNGSMSKQEYDMNLAKINGQIGTYNEQLTEASRNQEELLKTSAVFDTMSQSITRLVTQLGRKIFQNAINQTKRFVKEFDSAMTQIQMISLNSDQQMSNVKSSTIRNAIGLHTSVGNVTQTQAQLYRQGLNDSQVQSRMQSIIKFSTTAGIKVTQATKIITTALQNDLVKSAQEAMDALTALGDNAATTAAQIAKGMQKSAAAAKTAGVSYAQLTAMLTIGTSKTQLSGTQIGTAYQTIFSRLRSMSVENYAADQNGSITYANNAQQALATAGVSLRNKTDKSIRNATDILMDLASVWNDLGDAQQSVITTALAGTRQTNIFQTLMQGMGQDGGATFRQYLDLASNSSGITQSKYDIAVESISASLQTLRSSFDGLVQSIVGDLPIADAIDALSEFIQMITRGTQSLGALSSVLVMLIGGVGGHAIGSGLGSILGGALGTAVGGPVGTMIGKAIGGTIGTVIGASISTFALRGIGALSTDGPSYYDKMSSLTNKNQKLFGNIQSLSQSSRKLEQLSQSYGKVDASSEQANAILVQFNDTLSDLRGNIAGFSVDNVTSGLDEITAAADQAKQSIVDVITIQATSAFNNLKSQILTASEEKSFTEKNNSLDINQQDFIIGQVRQGYVKTTADVSDFDDENIYNEAYVKALFYPWQARLDKNNAQVGLGFTNREAVYNYIVENLPLETQMAKYGYDNVGDYLSKYASGNLNADTTQEDIDAINKIIVETVRASVNSQYSNFEGYTTAAKTLNAQDLINQIDFSAFAGDSQSYTYLQRALQKELVERNITTEEQLAAYLSQSDTVLQKIFNAYLDYVTGQSQYIDFNGAGISTDDFQYKYNVKDNDDVVVFQSNDTQSIRRYIQQHPEIDYANAANASGAQLFSNAKDIASVALTNAGNTPNYKNAVKAYEAFNGFASNSANAGRGFDAFDSYEYVQEFASGVGSNKAVTSLFNIANRKASNEQNLAYGNYTNAKLNDFMKYILPGAKFDNAFFEGTGMFDKLTSENKEQALDQLKFLTTDDDAIQIYQQFINYYGQAATNLVNAIMSGKDDYTAQLDAFRQAVQQKSIQEEYKYDESSSEIKSLINNINAGHNSARNATNARQQTITNRNKVKQAINRIKSGKAKGDDISLVAQYLGLDASQLQGMYYGGDRDKLNGILDSNMSTMDTSMYNTDYAVLKSILEKQGSSIDEYKTNRAAAIAKLTDDEKLFVQMLQDSGFNVFMEGYNGNYANPETFVSVRSKNKQDLTTSQYVNQYQNVANAYNGIRSVSTLGQSETELLKNDATLAMLVGLADQIPTYNQLVASYSTARTKGLNLTNDQMYGSMMSSIFGENWGTDMSASQGGTYSSNYKAIMSRGGYQAQFAKMALRAYGADNLFDQSGAFIGTDEQVQQIMNSVINKSLGQVSIDSSVISSAAKTISGFMGDAFSQATQFAVSYSGVRSAQSAQYSFNRISSGTYTSQDISTIAGYLNMSEQNVRSLMSSAKGMATLSSTFNSYVTQMADSYELVIKQLISDKGIDTTGGLNKEQLVQQLRENGVNEGLIEIIQMMSDVIVTAAGEVEITPGQFTQKLNQAIESAIDQYARSMVENTSNNVGGFNAMIEYSRQVAAGSDQQVASDYVHTLYPNFDISKFLQQNPSAAIYYELLQKGQITQGQFESYMTSGYYGGKKTSSYYTPVLKNMLLPDGTINTATFDDTMKKLTDPNSILYSAWSEYVSNNSDQADLLLRAYRNQGNRSELIGSWNENQSIALAQDKYLGNIYEGQYDKAIKALYTRDSGQFDSYLRELMSDRDNRLKARAAASRYKNGEDLQQGDYGLISQYYNIGQTQLQDNYNNGNFGAYNDTFRDRDNYDDTRNSIVTSQVLSIAASSGYMQRYNALVSAITQYGAVIQDGIDYSLEFWKQLDFAADTQHKYSVALKNNSSKQWEMIKQAYNSGGSSAVYNLGQQYQNTQIDIGSKVSDLTLQSLMANVDQYGITNDVINSFFDRNISGRQSNVMDFGWVYDYVFGEDRSNGVDLVKQRYNELKGVSGLDTILDEAMRTIGYKQPEKQEELDDIITNLMTTTQSYIQTDNVIAQAVNDAVTGIRSNHESQRFQTIHGLEENGLDLMDDLSAFRLYKNGVRTQSVKQRLSKSIGVQSSQLDKMSMEDIQKAMQTKVSQMVRVWSGITQTINGKKIEEISQQDIERIRTTMGDQYANLIQFFITSVNDGLGDLAGKAKTSFSQAIGTDFENKSQKRINEVKGFNVLARAAETYSATNGMLTPQQVLNGAAGDLNFTDFASWVSDNPSASLMWQAFTRGNITPDQFLAYTNANALGQERTFGYYSPAYDRLMGFGIGSGNGAQYLGSFAYGGIDESQMQTIYGNYQAMSNPNNEVDYALMQQLTGSWGNDAKTAFQSAMNFMATGDIEAATQAMQRFGQSIHQVTTNQGSKFSQFSSQIASNMKTITESYKGHLTVTSKWTNQLTQLGTGYNVLQTLDKPGYDIKRGKKLEYYKDNNAVKDLASASGLNADYLATRLATDYEGALDQAKQMIDAKTQEVNGQIVGTLNSMWDDVLSNVDPSQLPEITADGIVTVGQLRGLGDLRADMLAQIIQTLQGQHLIGNIGVSTDGKSLFANVDRAGMSRAGGGGRSKNKGSKGKSQAQKLIQQLNAAMEAFDHAQKMLEYAATYYEQNGFLTKQIKALQKQKALIEGYLPKLQQMIQKVRNAISGQKVGSEDWKKLAGQLNKLEEKYAELLNKNAALVKQIRQIRIKIKQLVVDVENSINDTIEADEQAQSSMLDGRVQMEQTILDAIRQRYQEEWDLIKKDLQNKKKALQEQMSLIDERLQKRKNAQDQAAKYEELSKLKQQLAMVQADGNRTADAAKIRDQISELEKQIGWDIAQRQAEAQKAVLQAQLDGYESYEQTGQQDLQAFLQDANNFTDQINDVMQSGYAGIMSWLETNVRAYRLSMQDEQQKMLEGWRGTYEQMMNISNLHYNPLTGQWQKLRQTDDYNEAMGSKQSYVEYMIKHSQAFAEASLPGNDFTKYKYDGSYADTDEGANLLSQAQQEMIMQWQDTYDAMTKALDGTEDQMSTADRYYANMQSFIDSFWKNFQNIMSGVFGTGSGSGSGGGGGGNGTQYVYKVYGSNGFVRYVDSQQKAQAVISQGQQSGMKLNFKKVNKSKLGKDVKVYGTGGQADYTGPAWLDGTFSRPERVLDPEQTSAFDNLVDILDTWSPDEFDTMRNMMNAMSYIDTSSMLPKFNLNDLGSGSNSTSIGDVYITLNEAKLEEDADYSAVAQRVGEEFAKQLSRQGVHTNYYMI